MFLRLKLNIYNPHEAIVLNSFFQPLTVHPILSDWILKIHVLKIIFLKSYNIYICHLNLNLLPWLCKSRVVSSEIETHSSSEYAGILLQMKMRASASLIFQRKPSSPKMINNLNNEVCQILEKKLLFIPLYRFLCKMWPNLMEFLQELKKRVSRNIFSSWMSISPP